MDLPDDCLNRIFSWLSCASEQEAFGLTCQRWLSLQNHNRQSLQFQCSLTRVTVSSLSTSSCIIGTFQVHKLISRFQNLHSLSFSGCTELSDSGLTLLQHYGPSLQSLNLDCCFGITDKGLPFVAAGCPSLTFISLYRCSITDTGLVAISNCSALQDVNLSCCSRITDYGIKVLLQNCSHIRAIRISNCRDVNGTGFRESCQNLAYLEAESCSLEPEGISGIVSGGALEYLNISSPSRTFCRDDLTAFGTGYAKMLRVLNMRMCRSVGDKSIAEIAKGCPVLEEWSLALCHDVRLSGWESIALNCLSLKKLHVNRCWNLCDWGLRALRNGCKKLTMLHMNGCPRLSLNEIELFKLSRGDVVIDVEEILTIGPSWALRWW